MALIDLQTDLTSLKYGKDRPGGGSSNQPYITSDIPEDDPVQSPDFLLRNGFLAPVSAAKDASRITQMFFDTKSPNGLLFTAKENLLSRLSVKTQASRKAGTALGTINQGVYLPTSTIAQTLVGFTGTHLNLLGIDPTGLSPLGIIPYGDLVEPKIGQGESIKIIHNNRLLNLANSKIKNDFIKPQLFKFNSISTDSNFILSYGGGPDSIVGIGKTKIKFADQRTGINNKNVDKLTVEISKKAGKGILLTRFNQITPPTPGGYEKSIDDFRKPLLEGKTTSTIMGIAPSYTNSTKTIEGKSTSRINYVSPGQKGNIINYTNGKRDENDPNIKLGPVDKINALPIYRSGGPKKDLPINDLVKFRIAAIDNNFQTSTDRDGNTKTTIEKDYIHFRAYIDSFSDAYNGSWNALRYMGRGENFYKYDGFTRTINLGFTVAAQSKEELIPMYKKLNFLASNLAPSYSDSGYMAGSLVTLTLGGWCYELPGFITSLTLDVPQESPWEIGINTEGGSDSTVKELPHIVKVTGFSFTPIEEFRPSKQKNTYGDPNPNLEDNNTYGPERYIALSNGGESNYGKVPTPSPSSESEVNTINLNTSIPGGVNIQDNQL